EATRALSKNELAQVKRRQAAIEEQRERNVDSGPSHNKGKVIDPKEWGNIEISSSELNPETQAIILQTYNTDKDNGAIPRKGKTKKFKKKKSTEENSSDDSDADNHFKVPHAPRHV
ncbi:hypothetical protein BYT27DRAFT_7316657, partial [Phlegmacium glaucopus]